MKEFFTTTEVAEMLKLNPARIRYLFRTGKLTGLKLSDKNGNIRFTKKDIEEFEEKCRK